MISFKRFLFPTFFFGIVFVAVQKKIAHTDNATRSNNSIFEISHEMKMNIKNVDMKFILFVRNHWKNSIGFAHQQ